MCTSTSLCVHGTYDRLPGAEKFGSKTFRWDAPIDEEAWRYAHNVCHHGGTNIAGKDPDIHLGLRRSAGGTTSLSISALHW